MEIALHVGANCTEGDRLLKSLLRNGDRLSEAGVAVPGPARYRPLLREAVLAGVRGLGADDAREVLLDAMLDGRGARRVVLSNTIFLSLPALVLDKGFFSTAAAKVRAAGDLFADDRLELFLAIRNPATWLPAVFAQTQGKTFASFSAGVNPMALRWSDLVRRLREAAPEAALTVWCNEDAALVWGELLARLAGLPPADRLDGRFDLMAAISAEEGMERFGKYIGLHPGQTPAQERRVVGAFLDKYAIPDRVEEVVDVPGWDARLVAALTEAYEEDVARIARMEGVTLVQP